MRLDSLASGDLDGAGDCNRNGIPDACDIAGGSSTDHDHDGVPYECQRPLFHRGDPNTDGATDVSDAIMILGFLFLDGEELPCRESADANDDGRIDIFDGIFLLDWLFVGGPEPEAPGPTGKPCGLGPDPPGSPGDLGCEAYPACS